MSKSHDTPSTDKPKRKAPRSAWKPGQSGNPGGRKRNTESISYWLSEFASMTGVQVAETLGMFSKEFKKAGDDMPLAAVIAARVILAVINEPDARLFGQLMDRLEGKVTQGKASIDLAKLTDEQLVRIANGEDPIYVAATPGNGDAGASGQTEAAPGIDPAVDA